VSSQPEREPVELRAAQAAAAQPDGWRRLDPKMLVVHPLREVLRQFQVIFDRLQGPGVAVNPDMPDPRRR